jgi:F420-dependent oxidoreductase-like protein
MRVPITLDLHLPNFNYPGVAPEDLFDKLVEIATTAENSGFSSISLMDHLHQIAMVGPPRNYMMEGSTMLAGIAARTEKLSLGLLVGSVTYRNPALAAKVTSTVDIVSKGRAWHGIGAGWFEEEHIAYGYDFPPLKTRFEMLEEHLQIVRSMFLGEHKTFHGTHFRIEEPYNNPLPIRGDIPILIGGSGERKTLRMVAQYGDGCSFFGDAERCTHLLGVLEAHCETVGRDPGEIAKTVMGTVCAAPTHEQAEAKVARLLEMGMPQERVPMLTIGDADTIAEKVQALADVGMEGMTISIPDVHDPETIEIAGKAISSVFGAPVV